MPVMNWIIGAALAPLAGAFASAPACTKPAATPTLVRDAAPASVDAAAIAACVVPAGRVDAAATLLDARRADGLREALPGAWRLNADTVTTPPFDIAEPVALIGDTAEVRRLAIQCAHWRAAGYANVRVVAGGIDGWRRAGRAPALAKPPLSLFGASALERRALDAPHALVFDADADPALRRLGTATHVARRDESPVDAARRIARDLEDARVVPGLDPIVVLLADRGAIDAWRDAWNATAYADPQFYVGTDAQYRTDLANAERIAAGRGKPLPGPCDR